RLRIHVAEQLAALPIPSSHRTPRLQPIGKANQIRAGLGKPFFRSLLSACYAGIIQPAMLNASCMSIT
ncbi:MAG TPA: hypothetical protein VMU82_18375, partial [Acetobacteraceae bacterium]|nr:hypothetical protein [Acetobacteraceae bacterium]